MARKRAGQGLDGSSGPWVSIGVHWVKSGPKLLRARNIRSNEPLSRPWVLIVGLRRTEVLESVIFIKLGRLLPKVVAKVKGLEGLDTRNGEGRDQGIGTGFEKEGD